MHGISVRRGGKRPPSNKGNENNEKPMTAKERKQEEKELAEAVRVLRATLRAIAHRKAQRYEHDFLLRVCDMIIQEIGSQAEANEFGADYIGRNVKTEILK